VNVCFRVDASIQIGSGHVMRCLTLADALRLQGTGITFICREHPGNLIGLIEAKGYQVERLQPPTTGCVATPDDVANAVLLGVSWLQDSADTIDALQETKREWLIVDHYALDYRWERKLRDHICKIMVIDDIADRPHDCDMLLDQNFYIDMESRYDGLVPGHCRKFFGPRCALLRPEFIEARRNLRERDGNVRRILLFFGGSDSTNETAKALAAIRLLNRTDIAVDAVVGWSNPRREEIQNICILMPNTVYHCQIANMAELMANADLAVGAGGTVAWERCHLGLPTLVLVTADNQSKTTQAADKAGLVRFTGTVPAVTAASLATDIGYMLHHPDELTSMTNNCLTFMRQRNFPVDDEILACLFEVKYAA